MVCADPHQVSSGVARQAGGAPAAVQVRFTDRTGGISRPPYDTLNLGPHVGDETVAVAENRRRAVAGPVAWMQQVHGGGVSYVERASTEAVAGCDGLVTSVPGLWLAVMVADCVPVLLADRTAGVVGAAHAGRRGLTAGIVSATLAAMARLGAESSRTIARLGPGICPRCYELPRHTVERLLDEVPGASARGADGTAAVDVAGGVRAQLIACGVAPRSIARSPRCTFEDPLLFSYRRDGVTGRFAGFIRLGVDTP